MFDLGGSHGVAVSVAPLHPPSWPDPALPPGVTARPSRLGDLLPVGRRSAAEIAAELQRVQRAKSGLAAYEAEL
ncbi:hypothetical protein SAMN05660485_03940, partial [Blastococcus fimeti]